MKNVCFPHYCGNIPYQLCKKRKKNIVIMSLGVQSRNCVILYCGRLYAINILFQEIYVLLYFQKSLQLLSRICFHSTSFCFMAEL